MNIVTRTLGFSQTWPCAWRPTLWRLRWSTFRLRSASFRTSRRSLTAWLWPSSRLRLFIHLCHFDNFFRRNRDDSLTCRTTDLLPGDMIAHSQIFLAVRASNFNGHSHKS
jgi:hypothetical protein